MQVWFKDWFNSPYYHQLYQHRTQQEADDFVKKMMENLPIKPGQLLLDIACGKGRHAIAFCQHGLEVTGIDLSEASIQIAKESETSTLHFYTHDMRQVFRVNYFDVVTNLFTSFGYFKTQHQNILAANTMAKALKPGGMLIVDYANKGFGEASIDKLPMEDIIKDQVRFTIKRQYSETQFIKDIYIQDGNHEEAYQELVNTFTLLQMQAIFKTVGLQFQAVYGDYQFNAYHETESPRMIMIFNK